MGIEGLVGCFGEVNYTQPAMAKSYLVSGVKIKTFCIRAPVLQSPGNEMEMLLSEVGGNKSCDSAHNYYS